MNADVAVVRKFPIERWRLDEFTEGSGVGVLYEDAEKFCGRFSEIFLKVLLEVDDER